MQDRQTFESAKGETISIGEHKMEVRKLKDTISELEYKLAKTEIKEKEDRPILKKKAKVEEEEISVKPKKKVIVEDEEPVREREREMPPPPEPEQEPPEEDMFMVKKKVKAPEEEPREEPPVEEPKKEPEPAPEGEAEYKPKIVKCKTCHEKILVKSPKRPIIITCPKCGTKGKLST
jgi:superfamily II DNA/RNA helicase